MKNNNSIKCPKCDTSIDVNEALYLQLEEKLSLDYQKKIEAKNKEVELHKNEIENIRIDLEKKQVSINAEIEKGINNRLKIEKSKLEKSLRASLEDETKEQIASMENELAEKSNKVKEFNKTKAELERIKREKEELRETIILEKEQEFAARLNNEKERIKNLSTAEHTLKIKELEKKLEDQNKLVEEMRRKSEQGSMQLQGEIQELVLKEILQNDYRYDIIEDVPKGISGADILQTVVNELQQRCGKIIYESKRTNSFSDGWIDKLKTDQRKQQADIALIITETLPKDMDRFGQKDGVWICSFAETKAVTFVLREILIKTHSVKSAEENRGDKMNMLYTYLTSEEFKRSIESIVDGFSGLKDELEKEKRAMQKIWKEREKQIEKVTANTIDMYASIKGIAGKAIGNVKALELGGSYEIKKLK